jgi:hypothetical protein
MCVYVGNYVTNDMQEHLGESAMVRAYTKGGWQEFVKLGPLYDQFAKECNTRHIIPNIPNFNLWHSIQIDNHH